VRELVPLPEIPELIAGGHAPSVDRMIGATASRCMPMRQRRHEPSLACGRAGMHSSITETVDEQARPNWLGLHSTPGLGRVCMHEWIPDERAAGGEVEDPRAAGWSATGLEVDHHRGRAQMATEESATRRLRPCRSLSAWPMPSYRWRVLGI
jgi:hypothetical protein